MALIGIGSGRLRMLCSVICVLATATGGLANLIHGRSIAGLASADNQTLSLSLGSQSVRHANLSSPSDVFFESIKAGVAFTRDQIISSHAGVKFDKAYSLYCSVLVAGEQLWWTESKLDRLLVKAAALEQMRSRIQNQEDTAAPITRGYTLSAVARTNDMARADWHEHAWDIESDSESTWQSFEWATIMHDSLMPASIAQRILTWKPTLRQQLRRYDRLSLIYYRMKDDAMPKVHIEFSKDYARYASAFEYDIQTDTITPTYRWIYREEP